MLVLFNETKGSFWGGISLRKCFGRLWASRWRKLDKSRNTNNKMNKIIDLSSYFKFDTSLYPQSGLLFYVFDNNKANSFVADCLVPFREAYITNDDVDRVVKDFSKTREDVIQRRLPEKGKVMSGDFGEILTFYLASQIWSPTANVLPMKWRFKDKKTAASNYTDIMLFELKDESNPSVDDALYTYEVKTRATNLPNAVYPTHKKKAFVTYKDGKQECTFIEAVVDANKDAVERAAETIPYLLTRCEDLGLTELHAKINRFSNPVDKTYRKEYNAVAVIDSSTLSEQMDRLPADLLSSHPNVGRVFCVPMDNLKEIYEKIYEAMPKNS